MSVVLSCRESDKFAKLIKFAFTDVSIMGSLYVLPPFDESGWVNFQEKLGFIHLPANNKALDLIWIYDIESSNFAWHWGIHFFVL